MNAGFTPGPWHNNCSHIYAPDGAIIAVVHNPGSKASDYPLEANRDLMTAAPELYRVLELVRFAETGAEDWSAVDDVLAKARGEQVPE